MNLFGFMASEPSRIFISSLLSLILHLLIGVLLVFSFNLTPEPRPQISQDINIVKAVAVDKKQVELELESIKKFEQEKRAKEQKRLADLTNKTKKLEQARKLEEQRLVATKKQKQQQQQQLKEKQAQLAKAEKKAQALDKAQQEKEQKLLETAAQNKKKQARLDNLTRETTALEKKRQDEEEKLAQATSEKEARRQQEIDEAHKQKEAEEKKLLAAALATEEAAEQAAKDQGLSASIIKTIQQSIAKNFNLVGLPNGLECKLLIRLVPGGEVISVSITKSSNHDVFDSRAVNATRKTSPLPMPTDIAIFERLGLREINMTFKPSN